MWRYWFYQVIVGIVFSENVVFEQGTIPANGQDGGDTLVKVEKVGAYLATEIQKSLHMNVSFLIDIDLHRRAGIVRTLSRH